MGVDVDEENLLLIVIMRVERHILTRAVVMVYRRN